MWKLYYYLTLNVLNHMLEEFNKLSDNILNKLDIIEILINKIYGKTN